MSNNFQANPGAGGDFFAAIDDGTAKHPQALVEYDVGGVPTMVSAANPLPVGIHSTVSTANSSVATLGIGAIFTGTAEDISNYAAVRVSVFANQASAANGLSIQQSSDGTNWDFADAYTVAASTQCLIGVPPYAKFIRIVYTNGGVANTVFRLQTVFHRTNTKPSSVRPGDAMSLQNDFEANIALLSFSNGTTADLARGDTTNGLDVDVTRLPSIPAGANVIGSLTANQSINLVQLNGITVALGSGGVSTGTLRVVQSSDTVPGTLIDNAAFTDGTTRIYIQGYVFDDVAGTALTENDAAAARIDSKRAQVLTLEDATTRGQKLAINASGAAATLNVAAATGGATPGKLIAAASTNATSVKGSAGTLYALMVTSVNAAARYIKFYNKASAPTVGTDVPVLVFGIPGNTAGNGFTLSIPACGINFSTGIAFAITTGIADADTGAVAASEIAVSYAYT